MIPELERRMPTTSDPLGETLCSLRMDGTVYATAELISPWGMEMPPLGGKMMFHIVTQGSCWLRFKDQDSLFLKTGDMALVPKGEGHCISHSNNQPCEPFFDIPVTRLTDRFEFMRYGGAGTEEQRTGEEETRLTCGVLGFDQIAAQKLIRELPQCIHIKGDDGALPAQLTTLIQLMEQEARALSPGGVTVMAHLADIIVIQAIRHWINSSAEASKGWLGALKDPKLGKALAAIHAHPEADWTVSRLARHAGMSRSGFSAQFTEVIGTSVKQYLTEWRMNLARLRIGQSPVTLTELAEELGYQSEAAFSRAYKRVFGVPPLRRKGCER